MTSSKIFFFICLSFILGIFLAATFNIHPPIFSGLFFIPPVFLFKRYRIIAVISLCIIFLLLGSFRYQVYDLKLKDSQIKQYNSKDVILLGKVSLEPDIKENSLQLTLNVQRILFENNVFDISGKVLIRTAKYPGYNYADVLAIEGHLEEPEDFEGFNYKEYLSKKGIFSLLDYPKIELAEKEAYSNVLEFCYGMILKFKNNIRENINSNFSYIQSKLLSGILLGDQSGFSEDFKNKLNISGLRHITAISGMNVAILCSVLMSLFLGLGFWRGQAFYLTLIFIFLFVCLVGFQASVVRAAIMGSLMLLAQKFGRLSSNTRAIVITAAVMLIFNPMLLKWDVGFQLSFLAMLGIVLLTKLLERVFKFIPQFINLRSIISATLSAQIFTLPILIYNFGRISLVAPLTNILVVPIVDLIMILGFLFGIISVISFFFGWIFIWPTALFLSYTIKVIDIFSQPWAAKTIDNVHWIWLVISYLIIGALVYWIKRKERLDFLEY